MGGKRINGQIWDAYHALGVAGYQLKIAKTPEEKYIAALAEDEATTVAQLAWKMAVSNGVRSELQQIADTAIKAGEKAAEEAAQPDNLPDFLATLPSDVAGKADHLLGNLYCDARRLAHAQRRLEIDPASRVVPLRSLEIALKVKITRAKSLVPEDFIEKAVADARQDGIALADAGLEWNQNLPPDEQPESPTQAQEDNDPWATLMASASEEQRTHYSFLRDRLYARASYVAYRRHGLSLMGVPKRSYDATIHEEKIFISERESELEKTAARARKILPEEIVTAVMEQAKTAGKTRAEAECPDGLGRADAKPQSSMPFHDNTKPQPSISREEEKSMIGQGLFDAAERLAYCTRLLDDPDFAAVGSTEDRRMLRLESQQLTLALPKLTKEAVALGIAVSNITDKADKAGNQRAWDALIAWQNTDEQQRTPRSHLELAEAGLFQAQRELACAERLLELERVGTVSLTEQSRIWAQQTGQEARRLIRGLDVTETEQKDVNIKAAKARAAKAGARDAWARLAEGAAALGEGKAIMTEKEQLYRACYMRAYAEEKLVTAPTDEARVWAGGLKDLAVNHCQYLCGHLTGVIDDEKRMVAHAEQAGRVAAQAGEELDFNTLVARIMPSRMFEAFTSFSIEKSSGGKDAQAPRDQHPWAVAANPASSRSTNGRG